MNTLKNSRERWAVFMDMDNTLTSHSVLVPENITAMREAQARGHLCVLNTGRSYGFIPKDVLRDGDFDAVIAGGGAYVRTRDEVLLEEDIPEDAGHELCSYFLQTDIPFYLEGVEKNYCMNEYREGFIRIRTLEDFPDRASKITILSARTSSLPEDAIRLIQKYFHFIQHDSYSECIIRGCSKASGMELILRHFGIPQKHSIGMGDSENDLEMLDYAAIAVAMQDSVPNVLKRADFVSCACADGGVAQALRRLLP
ncbi:MAG: HAD-IIB family hydrolase [Firmicutes bacterium]|nr:HAD-IIB family hydrolase [Bacillota bacterium]